MNEWKNDVIITKIDSHHCKLTGSHALESNVQRIFPISAEEFIDCWVRWTNGGDIDDSFSVLPKEDREFLLNGSTDAPPSEIEHQRIDVLLYDPEHPRNEGKFHGL